MHGRPRDYKEKLKDPKAAEAYAKKVAAIKQGTALVLECRRQRRFDAAALKASEKLLKVVPEIYTIWNFRREALQQVLEAGGDAAAAACEAELALTQACLTENPKAYSTWHHRKWVVLQGHADLQREMKLVNTALAVDGRNFHAWNYRQFLVKLMGLPTEGELAYSTSLIAADFSNYSAWHYRTLLLPRLHNEDITTVSFEDLMKSSGQQQQQVQQPPSGQQHQPTEPEHQQQPIKQLQQPQQQQPGDEPPQQPDHKQQQQHAVSVSPGALVGSFKGSASQTRPIPPHVLDQEYDMVHQALATDAGDESPWMYYRWLLGNSLAHLQQAQQDAEAAAAAAAGDSSGGGSSSGSSMQARVQEARAVLGEVLAREVSRFTAALQQDPDAKWPLLMTARLKEAQLSLGLCEGCGLDPTSLRAEVQGMYQQLQQLDPLRAGYYRDAAAGKAFVVVQALGTV